VQIESILLQSKYEPYIETSLNLDLVVLKKIRYDELKDMYLQFFIVSAKERFVLSKVVNNESVYPPFLYANYPTNLETTTEINKIILEFGTEKTQIEQHPYLQASGSSRIKEAIRRDLVEAGGTFEKPFNIEYDHISTWAQTKLDIILQSPELTKIIDSILDLDQNPALALLVKQPISTTPLDSATVLQQGYAYWNTGVKLKLDTPEVLSAVGGVTDLVKSFKVPNLPIFPFDPAPREPILGPFLVAGSHTIANGLGSHRKFSEFLSVNQTVDLDLSLSWTVKEVTADYVVFFTKTQSPFPAVNSTILSIVLQDTAVIDSRLKALSWLKGEKEKLGVTKALSDFSESVNEYKTSSIFNTDVTAKFIMFRPVVGDSVFTELAVKSLSSVYTNAPATRRTSTELGSLFVGVLFATDVLGALLKWAYLLLVMFGVKNVGFEAILRAAGFPSLSSLSPDFLENSIDTEMQAGDGLFQSIALAEQTKKDFESWWQDSYTHLASTSEHVSELVSAIQNVFTSIDPLSIPAEVFSEEKVENFLHGKSPSKENSVPVTLEGIDPFDTWFTIFSMTDIFGGVNQALGDVVNASLGLAGDLVGVATSSDKLVDKSFNSLETLINSRKASTDQLNSQLQTSLSALVDTVTRALVNTNSLSFSVLAIPPVTGGIEKLRIPLSHMLLNDPSRPKEFNSDSTVIGFMIYLGANTTTVVEGAFKQVSSFFNIIKNN
jgi:hypothetical protein